MLVLVLVLVLVLLLLRQLLRALRLLLRLHGRLLRLLREVGVAGSIGGLLCMCDALSQVVSNRPQHSR